MPQVINGIGSWYYGKRNLHRLRGVCSQCNAVGDLESYDTTLYFVVFFIPLLPLARKRVLESCPACQRHKELPLYKWHELKAENTSAVLAKLQADPNGREVALEALSVAAAFQDEELFDKMSKALADDRTDDAELQAALGQANGYFARHGRAAEAYLHSLRAKDEPRVREQLGLTLLRLGDPEQAAGCFKHILEERDGERAWLMYQLVVAYQAKGMHAAALEALDKVQEAFPETATVKDWQALRKISVKDRGRNRPVGKSVLQEGKGAGTREGSTLGNLLPKLILPLLLLAFAGWHTWRSLDLAAGRDMYLVSGAGKPYTVAVNGQPIPLAPGQMMPVSLPEGTITLAPAAGADGLEPSEVQVHSSFWARPYDGTRIVLNPDRLAVLVRETTIYAESPPPNPPDQFFAGKALHEIPSVDFAFEPFPNSMKANKGSSITKTRLGMAEIGTPESRVALVSEALPPPERLEYARRWLALEPDSTLALAWSCSTAPPADALTLLKTRLGDRPLRVEWHRIYQTLAERAGAKRDTLRDEYRKVVEESRREPDTLYLLARVSDRPEGLKLLHEATKSGKPADHAHYALGLRLLCETEYAAAAAKLDRASGLTKKGDPYQSVARDALLAARRYPDLLQILGEQGNQMSALRERVRVCTISGDEAGAQQASTAAFELLPAGIGADGTFRRMIQASMDSAKAAAKGDAAGYLAAVGQLPDSASIVNGILRNDLPGAEAAAKGEAPSDRATGRGLILLATPVAEATKIAAAKAAFLDALDAGDRDEKELRALLGRNDPDPVKAIRELGIPPRDKRVYAAAAGAFYPKQRPELLALSRKLDFFRDEVSLALKKVVGK